MKKDTGKKMTIDDLAVMVAKGFDGVHTEIGEFKREVNVRFGEVEKDIKEVKKDITEVKENLASTRRDVLSMGDRFTLKYEFHDLSTRVGILEQRRKVKR